MSPDPYPEERHYDHRQLAFMAADDMKAFVRHVEALQEIVKPDPVLHSELANLGLDRRSIGFLMALHHQMLGLGRRWNSRR